MTQSAILLRAETIRDAAATHSHICMRGRLIDCDFLLEIGTTAYLLRIREGAIIEFKRGPHLMANWAFAVRAEADVWEHFWSPLPPAPYHDIFALMKSGKMRIEGDLKPLMTHLMYFKLLLALPRQTELRLDAARH